MTIAASAQRSKRRRRTVASGVINQVSERRTVRTMHRVLRHERGVMLLAVLDARSHCRAFFVGSRGSSQKIIRATVGVSWDATGAHRIPRHPAGLTPYQV